MKNVIKDTAILFIITLISGLLLGYVHDITKAPIAAQKEKQKMEACAKVFPAADSFADVEGFSSEEAKAVIAEAGFNSDDITGLSCAYDKDQNVLGYVITVTSHEGYGGDIQFSMGVMSDGTLNGISLLSIAETAGLGMRAEEVLVPQFTNKKVDTFTYTKTGATSDSQIDAISSATITTNAVTNGVNAGLAYFQNALEGGNGNE